MKSTMGMIDIETLGTHYDSVVLTIGCCKFNPFDPTEEPYDINLWKLEVEDQVGLGRKIDKGTIEWWGKQQKHIRDEAFSQYDRMPTHKVLQELNLWSKDCTKMWSQGPSFDMAILSSLYRDFKMSTGWNFWDERDARTITSLIPREFKKGVLQNAHSASADAIAQAKCVQESFRANRLEFMI
jgi:hypothetical protein